MIFQSNATIVLAGSLRVHTPSVGPSHYVQVLLSVYSTTSGVGFPSMPSIANCLLWKTNGRKLVAGFVRVRTPSLGRGVLRLGATKQGPSKNGFRARV